MTKTTTATTTTTTTKLYSLVGGYTQKLMFVLLMSLSQTQPDLRNRSSKGHFFFVTDAFGKMCDRSMHCACVDIVLSVRLLLFLSVRPLVLYMGLYSGVCSVFTCY
jgi:hypothetical protein